MAHYPNPKACRSLDSTFLTPQTSISDTLALYAAAEQVFNTSSQGAARVPVHTVAKRLGHDAGVLLWVYAKRTQESDESAAETIGKMTRGMLI
jgi:hypothetical protein